MTNEPNYSVKPAGKGTGIASFVCSLLSVLCCCSALFSIPALICGIVSAVQAKNSGNKASGLAIAGIIISIIAIILWLISVVIMFTNPEVMTAYEEYLNGLVATM